MILGSRFDWQDVVGILPPATALARTVDSSIDSATNIKLNDETTLIQVYAITKDVYLKWADNDKDYVKADNFDEVIIAGTIVNLLVPRKRDGTFYTEISVLSREASATVIVIEK